MPNYSASPAGGVRALYSGDSLILFAAEQPAPPQASQQAAIGPAADGASPFALSAEGYFSGAPGAFELDVQTADTDEDAAYQNVPGAGAITAVDANQRFRVELVDLAAKFVRLRLASRTNAVDLTAKVSKR